MDPGSVADSVDQGIHEVAHVSLRQAEGADADVVAPQRQDNDPGFLVPGQTHRSTVPASVQKDVAATTVLRF